MDMTIVDIISAYWIAFLNYCTFRHSWIPTHIFLSSARSLFVRTSLSRTESKADTIIISEEKSNSVFNLLSGDHISSEPFADHHQ